MNNTLMKHKTRLQEQIDVATKQIEQLKNLEQQSIPDFQTVHAVTRKDSWVNNFQSGDEWITEYAIDFFEAETDNGSFGFAIDYEENEGELDLSIGRLSFPNATKEQVELLYNVLQEERQRVVLLHDYLNLEAFLKASEVSFVCINNQAIEHLTVGSCYTGYFFDRGQQYEETFINENAYYVKLDNYNYYYFNNSEIGRYFRVEENKV